jgi:hypothetical protein
VLNRSVERRVPNDIKYVPGITLPMSEDKGPENFFHRRLLLEAGFASIKLLCISKICKTVTVTAYKITSRVTSHDGLR